MSSVQTILLVEDNPDHAELIIQAASELDMNCRFDVVSNGVDAIEHLFRSADRKNSQASPLPDLILLDLKMPRMSGLDMLKVLRNTHHDKKFSLPPVVVLSSSSNDEDIQKAYANGAFSYLVKPVDAEQFNAVVTKAISYWLELNQPCHAESLYSHALSSPH